MSEAPNEPPKIPIIDLDKFQEEMDENGANTDNAIPRIGGHHDVSTPNGDGSPRRVFVNPNWDPKTGTMQGEDNDNPNV